MKWERIDKHQNEWIIFHASHIKIFSKNFKWSDDMIYTRRIGLGLILGGGVPKICQTTKWRHYRDKLKMRNEQNASRELCVWSLKNITIFSEKRWGFGEWWMIYLIHIALKLEKLCKNKQQIHQFINGIIFPYILIL